MAPLQVRVECRITVIVVVKVLPVRVAPRASAGKPRDRGAASSLDVAFHQLKSFMQQRVPGEMLSSKPLIIVMSLRNFRSLGDLCRCINRGPRSSRSVALGGRCEKILIVGDQADDPAAFITSR